MIYIFIWNLGFNSASFRGHRVDAADFIYEKFPDFDRNIIWSLEQIGDGPDGEYRVYWGKQR